MRHQTRALVVLASAAAVLAGCASTPRQSPQLAQARSAVETLSARPRALEAAGPDLKAARAELSRADQALRNGKPMDEVNHLAYLSMRHAQAGDARVAAADAQAEVAQSNQERQQLLLEAQKHQAMAAQQQAQSAQQQVQAAKGQAQQARNQAQLAQQQLKQMQTQQLGAKRTDQGMVVTLSNVLFSTSKATLEAGAHLQLERLAQYLKDHPKERVLIQGNTDSTGNPTKNQELSSARAQAVAQALELRGVRQSQYQTIGLGEAYPIASNGNSAGRQQNRRVDIVFSNESGQFSEAALSRQNPIRR